ncbi:MAG: hypothetical protein M9934_13695 [Thermomicrobiales bacterium]|nr:hypothetical protein [Thermomicrobiales bacterium]
MNARRNIGIVLVGCLAVVLTACGNDQEASPSTPEPTVVATQATIVKPQTPVPTSSAATPVTETTAVATPVVDASPLAGTLVLVGQEHVDFYISSDGCYGLGAWRGLQPGAQVVVRDASGTVVDVSNLIASTDDGCAWTFETSAPSDRFVSVSVPMVLEHWLTADEVVSGNVVIELP